jgi:nitrile hydratase
MAGKHHEPHVHGGSGGEARRAEAIETLLREKGLVDPGTIDAIISLYEKDIGPMNGAQVVARSWVDAAYKRRLLENATAAIAELGFGGPQGEHIVAVENTPDVHNVVVCTLCSCYPWPVLGLPPSWYKEPAYRARMVREPRVLLAEMGLRLDDGVEIRVWDSSAEVRYLVLPERPPGTEGMSEGALAALVTRDSMIGVSRLAAPVAGPTGGDAR